MSPNLVIRLPAHLMRAARSAAKTAGLGVTVWARQLIEKETGVEAGEMVQGKNHVSPERRSELASAASLARWARVKDKKRG